MSLLFFNTQVYHYFDIVMFLYTLNHVIKLGKLKLNLSIREMITIA